MTRIALFSPLPPARSGIADYSAALLDPLERLAQVETFTEIPREFDPAGFDAIVYQLGNNPHHAFVYEMAIRHPGIVVLHEANLHHLIAHMTIQRGDWDGYLREIETGAGAEALEYARRYVRTGDRAPAYDVPLLKSILARSRAAIVHSAAVEQELRAHDFRGQIARIPHGAWIVDADRMLYRSRLGIDESTPLIGMFGFLKPYKRIAESLRAFARLSRVRPNARMILVGEAHEGMKLNLPPNARHIDFAPMEDFNGLLSACDVVLNLRYPTVGESSGTLLRAFGMGKAAIVSDVGSFREFPDEICLKVPVDSSEEDCLFEFMNLLVSRPEVARAVGAKARAWVERECSWESVARRYVDFVEGKPEQALAVRDRAEPLDAPEVEKYIQSWATVAEGSKQYVDTHLTRLERTLEITPRGGPQDRVLEMGAYLHITAALKTRLGYGEVRGCYFGEAGKVHSRSGISATGETFDCAIDLFNAERDGFPYAGEYFSTVLCGELLEHLAADPMHMMMEINRVLKPGGHVVLTTPNIVSLRAAAAILQGFHPMLFPAYIRPRTEGEIEARHNREYTPREIDALLQNSGFEVTLLETGPFRDAPKPELRWVEHLLDRYILDPANRGDGIYAVGRKAGPVRDRYPGWLYQ